MPHFLGIDIGTSGTKTLLVGPEGEIFGSATAPHPLSHPKPGWSEQDPEDWRKAVIDSIQQVLKKSGLSPSEIKGIGLSGQMHGSVFLDGEGKVIRPALLWNDQRTAAECAEITEKVGAERLLKLTLNPALTGFTAPKILWLRKNEPKNFERVKKILLPKDYIRFLLTADHATDVSDASGTLLFDVRNRTWSKEMLSALQIDPSLLPESVESPEVTGRVSPGGALMTGLMPGTPIVGGGGDQAAGAVGAGIVKRGVISASLGTSGVVFAFSEKVETDPKGRVHTFCHAVPGAWHVMGVMLAAGGSFQWFRNQMAEEERKAAAKKKGADPYDLLCGAAEKAPAGCEGLLFLPYLTGERTPHADPNARAAWIGITPRTDRPALIRSILEGVAFGMKDSLEIIRGMKIPIEEIRVSGGGGKNGFWRRIQASIYERPVHTINAAEGPAYGAALLAMVGTGRFKTVAEACDATIRAGERTDPVPEWTAAYKRSYALFKRLYPHLREDFKEMAKLA